METMTINQTQFYYATYAGRQMSVDGSGYYTGESSISYSNPVSAYGNVSAARGEASVEQFGQDVAYDKIIVSCDTTLPITDTTIIWLDNNPASQPHDYIVKKVAKSLNVISIAIRKVEVT